MDHGEAPRRSARVAAVFDRVADTYDNVGIAWFTPIAQRLVQVVTPAPGERALDLGCGRGAAVFPLAEAVGPSGRVTGIDLASRMVAATRADVETRGLTHVDLYVMDATAPQLPASGYDVAVASLVLFFLPDPVVALRAWRELLVPGGRLGVSTFAERDPRWKNVDDVFRPYLPPHLLDTRGSGASSPFASDAGVHGLLETAGYGRIRTSSLDIDVVFADAEQWHTWTWSHGHRMMWESVPDSDRDLVRAAAADRLDACRDADGWIRLTQRVRFTVAERIG